MYLINILCFTPLQTYKVLKPAYKQTDGMYSFTPLQTYKVLKLTNAYKYVWRFYTITNLQGSQTKYGLEFKDTSFTPLQTYKVLKPKLRITGSCHSFTPLQTYKVLKPLSALGTVR